MKRVFLFAAMMLLASMTVFTGCDKNNHCCETDSSLAAIDSLLWSQPDSAFARLQDFDTNHGIDSLDAFNKHYYHLLLSELLYKNYCEQSNRSELLNAVDYFDSLVDAGGNRILPDLVFLDARAHYIDGAGYYEMDSLVPACEHYLKAVELMEEGFAEKELVGKKAQFMAMAYTRLTDVFSDQYLHEQAVHFGKLSLSYYNRYDATPWHVSWMLDKVGSQFFMVNQIDSADYYFNNALAFLPDSNCLTYRDIASVRALLSFYSGDNPKKDQEALCRLVNQAETKEEYLNRCLNLSDLFMYEKNYDSAWVYLTKVFNETDNNEVKRQAAEWLVEVCKHQGKSSELYSDFLVPYANMEENNSPMKSKLADSFDTFRLRTMEHYHRRKVAENIKWTIFVTGGLLLVILVLVLFYHEEKRHVNTLSRQIHEQNSKSNRWKNMELFLNEPVCREIIGSIKGKTIKRSSTSIKYPEYALDEGQLELLGLTVNRYFGPIEDRFEHLDIILNPTILNQCRLYLLGMDEKQIAVLLDKDYSSIIRYENKLKRALKTQKNLVTYLRKMVLNS